MKTPTLVYLVSKIFGWWVDDHRPNGTFSTAADTKKPNDSDSNFLVPNLFGFRFGFWLKKIVVENCSGCFKFGMEMGISLGRLKQDIVTCLWFVLYSNRIFGNRSHKPSEEDSWSTNFGT
jgi:hypothetical protein